MPLDSTPWPQNATARTLLKAAARIREVGWWSPRHGLREHNSVCALLAIDDVTIYGRDLEDAANALREYIGGGRIPMWNDAPERTAEEVIAALEGAAFALSAVSPTSEESVGIPRQAD